MNKTGIKLNHIALYVNNLEKMKSFYEKYFNANSATKFQAKPNEMYHNQKTGLKTYFLEFGNDCRIEIMTKENLTNIKKEINSTGYIHIAFSLGSKERVDELTRLLENDGYKVLSYPRTTGDGYYESCVLDPENNQIEIVE